jgi:tRNA pseudouridine55 synthase
MKRKGDAVSGILVLDKALRLGSTQAVGRTRFLMQANKAGHGGTLDPLATGVLPILFGDATKLAIDLLEADKTYEASVLLGVSTTTADAEGQILSQQSIAHLTQESVQVILPQFTGPILQIPPMYSALKRDGKPLYEYARAGVTLALTARPVTIYELTLIECTLPHLQLRVRCSKGTYIRSLARDIGDALGCGAHLSGLRRTQAGSLDLSQSHTVANLEQMDLTARRACLLPVDRLLQSLPRIDLDELAAQRVRQGQRVPWNIHAAIESVADTEAENGVKVRLYLNNELIGLAIALDGILSPSRIVATQQ